MYISIFNGSILICKFLTPVIEIIQPIFIRFAFLSNPSGQDWDSTLLGSMQVVHMSARKQAIAWFITVQCCNTGNFVKTDGKKFLCSENLVSIKKNGFTVLFHQIIKSNFQIFKLLQYVGEAKTVLYRLAAFSICVSYNFLGIWLFQSSKDKQIRSGKKLEAYQLVKWVNGYRWLHIFQDWTVSVM